jgi:GH24 family phage-related lysozyme (muramidase)|tara:strand:- start:3428 stop:3922 length:495 start_codon:yes stop_codon:yes gene_type:complete
METATSFKEKLYEHIKLREGYKDVVYLDTLGKPTGGVGHLLTSEERKIYPVACMLKESIIVEWYEKDIEKALNACNEQCKILGIHEIDFKISLTSVNFQLGTKWYRKFPSAWKALCHKDYDKAIDEILYANKEEERYSRWYKQTPVRVKDFIESIKQIKEMENG